MVVGTIGLGTVVEKCVKGEWRGGLLVEEADFIVDEVIGGVNGRFGMAGDAFNERFPLPSPGLEFPGCTDMVRVGSLCVLPLLAMVWECTHDDKTCSSSCG